MTADRVESIVVEPEQIVIRGQCRAGVPEIAPALEVREAQPYAPVSDLTGEVPIDGVTVDAEPPACFRLRFPRFDRGRDRLYSRFHVSRSTLQGQPPEHLPGVRYPTNLDSISAHDYPYPTSPTIKGLQVRMVDDAIALGVGHAAVNLNQANVMRPAPTEQTVTHRVDGCDYHFDEAYMRTFDQTVKDLSDRGIVVNLILLNSTRWHGMEMHPDLRQALLHPHYDPEGFISAFNVVTAEGLAHYRAFVEFVAARYTRPDARHGRACGYIIGNEVDSQFVWCNAGEMPVEDYVREYAIAMRTAFYAARKQFSQARVYVSLDHLWTATHKENPLRYYRGRDVLDLLNTYCVEEGNFQWDLAYHPYPQNLFHANFWDDETATDSFGTPRITFKNIELLPRYLSQPRFLIGGRPRHIILSEQGFHSDETEESERLQAAAYAYAYWKVERAPEIESFIYHAHVDNRDEFGLNLGLWRRDKQSESANAPGSPKPIYHVFRDIDGPRKDEILREARAVVGTEKWH